MHHFPLLTLVALVAVVAVAKAGLFDSAEIPPQKRSANKADLTVPSVTGEAESGEGVPLSPSEALGQMIVARFSGTNPSPGFLKRIRAGEIGGVILFEENLEGGDAAIRGRVERLQRAAMTGDNPRLLMMVDQEGGAVRRLPGAPKIAPRSMTDPDQAREEGAAAGRLLRRLGIDVDLAPVVDVYHPGSFLKARSFSSSPSTVANRACEFAAGLRSEGIAATLKHFPGLGMARTSTDESIVTIKASRSAIRAGYAPYQACGSLPLTLVMVDSAIYPNLTGELPAVMSRRTYKHELPLAGVTGPTISDALESPPIEAQATPARRSIDAGLDLLLYAKSETASAEAFSRLLDDIRTGAVNPETISTAAAKIIALKEQLTATRSGSDR